VTTKAAAGALPGSPARQTALTLALVGIALGVYAPILYHMAGHWAAVEDYSHGFLVAPLALFFAWERRGALRGARVAPSWWGLAPLGLGTLTLAIGRLGVELMNLRVSFVLTLSGLVGLGLGREVLRVLAFPLGFLFLMVPLPQSLVNEVAFPLQLGAADLAVRLLHGLGAPALREGNIIHLPQTSLFVKDACSGLRSLMALLTLGVVFAYFFRRGWVERSVIVLSTLPIAVAVNALRVALVGWLTGRFGEAAAQGPIHEFQGLSTFAAAFLLLLVEAWCLARLRPGRRARAHP
jgi:exosortase